MPSSCEPLSVRQSLSFAWNLPSRLDLVVSSGDLSASPALGFQIRTILSGFFMWSLGFYSGPHACKANTYQSSHLHNPGLCPLDDECSVSLCLCSCEQVPGVSFLGGLLPFVLVESVKWPLRQDSSPTSGSHCLKVSAVAGSRAG